MLSKLNMSMIESQFQSTDDGQPLFYPSGRLMSGYVIPDPATAQRLRSGAARNNAIAWTGIFVGILPFGVLQSIMGPDWASFGALVAVGSILTAVIFVLQWRLVAGLTAVDRPFQVTQSAASMGKLMPPWLVTTYLILSGVLFAGSMIMTVMGPTLSIRANGVFGIAIFGGCLAVGLMMQAASRKATRGQID